MLDLGLYVHVPFCAHRCFYCDFTAYISRPDLIRSYLDGVGTEAALLAGADRMSGREALTLYVGGGTPTALGPREMEELFGAVRTRFSLRPGAEVTCEANPETIDMDKLSVLRAAGCNRLSLGLQVWDDRRLAGIGRRHTTAGFLASYRSARAAGFDNIGVDLIYGLPGQTVSDWRETLRQVVALEPEHVSAYCLQVEERTTLARWVREGRFDSSSRLPGEEAELEMYLAAREELTRTGYEHYEISNFARPGRRSRHNQLYWRNQEYLGLGPAAHSRWGRYRSANVCRLDRYRELLAEGRKPLDLREEITSEKDMSDTVILGLRLLEGIELAGFERRFGRSLFDVYPAAVAEVVEADLAEARCGRLRLTDRGLPLANRVFLCFA